MELDLLGRVGQVVLDQRVGHQSGQALQDEAEVLGKDRKEKQQSINLR